MFLLFLTKILALSLSAFAGTPPPAPFKICAEPNNFPMSQQASSSGYEIEVAKLLAQDLGRPLEIKWIQQRDPSYFRMTIGKGVCDAIMGVPPGFDRLLTTQPWYRTGFMFVTRADAGSAPTSFDDPKLKKLTIGIPSTGDGETTAGLALSRHGLAANTRPFSIFDSHEMISAVAKKEIGLAVVFGPFAGWFAGDKDEYKDTPLVVTPTPDKDASFPLAFDISIGVKKDNQVLRDQLNTAIEHKREAIANVLKKWRVPLRKS